MPSRSSSATAARKSVTASSGRVGADRLHARLRDVAIAASRLGDRVHHAEVPAAVLADDGEASGRTSPSSVGRVHVRALAAEHLVEEERAERHLVAVDA